MHVWKQASKQAMVTALKVLCAKPAKLVAGSDNFYSQVQRLLALTSSLICKLNLLCLHLKQAGGEYSSRVHTADVTYVSTYEPSSTDCEVVGLWVR